MSERCLYAMQLGYFLGDLSSCWCYYNSLQLCCFRCFLNPSGRCCLEEGPCELELELEADFEKGVHMGLVRREDVGGVVVEERLGEEQEHAKEAAKDVK